VRCVRFGPVNHSRQWAKTLPASRSSSRARSRLLSVTISAVASRSPSTARGTSWVNWRNWADRPALVDAIAQESVEALVIAPERLRALIIAEAELGERIMRALILRRVAILQTGTGGPIILGRAENGDVAIGDVRANSVKRVAAAVGEGAQVVAALHAFLAGTELNLAGTLQAQA
jgi:hypothetical protein